MAAPYGMPNPFGPSTPDMFPFIIKRLLTLLWLLPTVTLLTFLLMQAKPGDFLTPLTMQRDISPETIVRMKHDFGLDQPFYLQYFYWLERAVLHFDLGESWSYKIPVTDLILQRAPATIALALSSLLVVWLVGVPLGIMAAIYKDSVFDRISAAFAYAAFSIPEFFLALLAILLAWRTGWFPIGGLTSIDHEFMSPTTQIGDFMYHMILPTLVVSLGGIAGLMRVMRANILDVVRAEYVTAARAKGLPEGIILFRYVLKNAINPFLSTIGYAIAGILSGSLIVENVMNYPGLGQLIYQAYMRDDRYVVLGSLVISILLLIIGNLVSDIVLAMSDPRIRYGK